MKTAFRARRLFRKPEFSHVVGLADDDVMAIFLRQTTVTLNRFVYVGFSVLDVSKVALWRLHYDWVSFYNQRNYKLVGQVMTDLS